MRSLLISAALLALGTSSAHALHDHGGAPRCSTPAADNPSFATNTSSWTAVDSTITRDTVVFDTGPASGRWDRTGASDNLHSGDTLTETFTGTFKKGATYRLDIQARAGAGFLTFNAAFGDLASGDVASVDLQAGTVFTALSVVWVPTADRTSVSLRLTSGRGTTYLYVDSLLLYKILATIVDRQGFRRTMRLPISAALPADGQVAAALADVWLSDHKLIPFKGTVTVQEGAVREVLTGATVPLELLPIRTMELLRFNDRNDPDTGGQGRDGRIVAAKWTHATDSCEITIDNTRAYFDALLSRLAAFTGS
jgi:hypothetical protein